MKKKQKVFRQKLFLKKEIMITSIIVLCTVSSVFAQDTTADNQSTITVRTQQIPPLLPDYFQSLCPADGYMWTPGHWRFYDDFYGWHPVYWGG